MCQLRDRLTAAAGDTISMQAIVREAGGLDALRKLDPSNAKSALEKAAREIQRRNKELAPPAQIDTKAIDAWIARYGKVVKPNEE